MPSFNAGQLRFIEEYLVDVNATQAAIRAGYSEKTAHSQGQRLLKHVGVAAEIQKRMNERSARTEITSDKVLHELARLGFSDLRKLFNDNGSLRPISEIDDDTAACISSVEVVTRPSGSVDADGNREVEYVHKIRMWDKNSALEKIGKHLVMFTDKTRLEGEDGGPLQLFISRKPK